MNSSENGNSRGGSSSFDGAGGMFSHDIVGFCFFGHVFYLFFGHDFCLLSTFSNRGLLNLARVGLAFCGNGL